MLHTSVTGVRQHASFLLCSCCGISKSRCWLSVSISPHNVTRNTLHIHRTYMNYEHISSTEQYQVKKMLLMSCFCAFSALTLLVGWQEGHPACKNWVMRYWHGYLSGARCKWFAYGSADATATPSSLAPVKSGMVYLSAGPLNGCTTEQYQVKKMLLMSCFLDTIVKCNFFGTLPLSPTTVWLGLTRHELNLGRLHENPSSSPLSHRHRVTYSQIPWNEKCPGMDSLVTAAAL